MYLRLYVVRFLQRTISVNGMDVTKHERHSVGYSTEVRLPQSVASVPDTLAVPSRSLPPSPSSSRCGSPTTVATLLLSWMGLGTEENDVAPVP